MSRLVVVSNRVPMPRAHAAGGLTSGMLSALRDSGGIWFGWNGKTLTEPATSVDIHEDGNISFATLGLSRRDVTEYYAGFANRTLWPLFHFRPSLVDFSRANYDAYVRVNSHFAERLAPLLRADDLVWINDYHLIPLGAELRRLGVRARMGFFLHTPLPPSDLLVTLPVHRELFEALLAYDVVGFQTDRYLRAFREYIVSEAHGEVNDRGMISIGGGRHSVKAGVFPIGIDVEHTAQQAIDALNLAPVRALRESIGPRALVIGVDRLDYSKGIPERLEAFARLLERFPEWRNQVSFVQVSVPTRSEVPEYAELRSRVEALVGRINGSFGEADWVPVRYLYRSYDQATLARLYRKAAVGLVTPLRDGMNLVAKEYVASQDPDDPGVLVLSQFAGAAEHMTLAVMTNPYHADGLAADLDTALRMPRQERVTRHGALRAIVWKDTAAAWAASFLDALRA